MKYLVDLSHRQADKIHKYLNDGRYSSFGQFMNAAIENQFHLEDEGDPNGAILANNPAITISANQNQHTSGIIDKYKIINLNRQRICIPAPEFENLVLCTQNKLEKNTWIWGQINKLLPVKIGLRILQSMLESNRLVNLNEFLSAAAIEASRIGDIVREHEKRNHKDRDDKISAGLPHFSDEKSQTRYKFQFLVYQRKDGLLDGAMALLRFCNLEKKGGKLYIGITDQGEIFSNESNPTLDDENFDLAFNQSEIDLYLNHLTKYVTSEATAIKWLLGKVNEGLNDRSTLNAELMKDCGKLWHATDPIINTQRSGITARVFELGLIDKEKNGKNVTYRVTERGLKYITQAKSKS
jgi:hypothetical protein